VAGVLALLAGAFPAASVAALEAALLGSARDLGPPGADPDYGAGLVDALAAYQALRQAEARH
jgi:subtilisin family serine protease